MDLLLVRVVQHFPFQILIGHGVDYNGIEFTQERVSGV